MDQAPIGGRRSQRVRFEMPIDVYVYRENEEPKFEACQTLSVNAHGGLLALTTPVAFGEKVRLVNPRTRKEIEGRVSRFGMQYPSGMNQVGVEFLTPLPTFWDIASPPADWDPAWVPPAQRMRAPPPLPPEPVSPMEEWNAGSRPKGRPRLNARKGRRESLKAGKTKPSGWRALKWPMFALAASAALLTLWTAARRSTDDGTAALQNAASPGVAPEDALVIPGIERFRLARVEDFDPEAVSWLQGFGRQVSGKIPGAYSGSGESIAYVLIGKENVRRVVILVNGQKRYDAEYPVIAVAARIPKELIQKISWADPSPPVSDGDGLLIVRAADAPASSVVLFLRGTRVVSANPADYRQIPLS
jgi:hypothetical protein